MKVAIYPGTFDPITRGHEDLIQRGLAFADRVIVGVTSAGGKAPLFTLEERVALARECLGTEPRFEARPFEGLLVDYILGGGQSNVLRGDFGGNVHLGFKIENGRLARE